MLSSILRKALIMSTGEGLRTPLYVVALVLLLLAVLLEIGSPWAARILSGAGSVTSQLDASGIAEKLGIDQGDVENSINNASGESPPGLGVPALALLDGLLLFTVALMGASLILPERIHGRIQGVVTLLVSLSVLLAGIALAFKAFALLMLMITLLLAIPFGTLVYLVKYGSFDRGAAAAILSAVMLLKLGFAGFLAFAQQRFLSMKGLVLIVITSLIAVIIVTFLHGLVPGILVSITDAIAGIVVAILAILWAAFLLLGSIISVIKAIKLKG